MSDRTRTRNNGRAVEPPKPLPQLTYWEQQGAIMTALAVTSGRADTRAAARRMVGDDVLYGHIARAVLAVVRACPFVRSAEAEANLVKELQILKASQEFLSGGAE